MNNSYLKAFIKHAIKEDVGSGDHSTLACIPKNKKEKAKLFVKSKNAIIAGVDISTYIFKYLDKSIKIKTFKKDGDEVKEGDIIFTIEGRVHPILMAERLVLNTMQRMSGVATYTREYVNKIADLPTKIIDTRKTCPGMRHLQKAAVKIGG